jgi:hypothetical protein
LLVSVREEVVAALAGAVATAPSMNAKKSDAKIRLYMIFLSL